MTWLKQKDPGCSWSRRALAAGLTLCGSVWIGCSVDERPVVPANALSTLSVVGVNGVPGEYCTTLFAGQTIDAGSVCVEVADNGNSEDLCVTYTTSGNWKLIGTHTWVGTALANMPQNRKGHPQIGQFPYHSGNLNGQTTYSVCIPLAAFGGEAGLCAQNMLVATHAEVGLDSNGDGVYEQTETAWGDGARMVTRGTWATYFSIVFNCADVPNNFSSETAWAFGCDAATCFLDIPDEDGTGFDRWGWSNGPFSEEGTYTFDLYAGAGDCDRENGTLVGELIVAYQGTTADITFTACGTYEMSETQVYVGPEILPRFEGDYTIAPGQFTHSNEFPEGVVTDTYEVLNVQPGFHVVAHAVVWGDYNLNVDCGTAGCNFTALVPPCELDEIVMLSVPSGSFACGGEITLTNNYEMSKYEITNGQFVCALNWALVNQDLLDYQIEITSTEVKAFGPTFTQERRLLSLNAYGSDFSFENGVFSLRPVYGGTYQGQDSDDHPARGMTWLGAAFFCDWVSLMLGLDPFYQNDAMWADRCVRNPYDYQGYRLPTEAEWEYAALFGTNGSYPWGNQTPTCDLTNWNGCVNWTSPVGSHPAGTSLLGFQDMSGNVWEMTNNFYPNNSPYGVNPVGSCSYTGGNQFSNPEMVIKGGGWYYNSANYQSIAHDHPDGWLGGESDGFRLCRTLFDANINHPPTVSSTTPSVHAVAINGIVTISCDAFDPDQDPLTYTWSATGGNFSGGNFGESIQWVASDVSGTVVITVSISDGQYTVTSSVSISITSPLDCLVDMVSVPAGSFNMGQAGIATPEHQVTLTTNYQLSRFEITNEQYVCAMQWAYDHGLVTANANGVWAHGVQLLDLSYWANVGYAPNRIAFADGVFSFKNVEIGSYSGQSSADHPVMCISWFGAACYCDWLSMMHVPTIEPYYTGLWDQIPGLRNPYVAEGFRLPTEAEWEFAAQYNNERTYPWGNQLPDCSRMNFRPYPAPECIGWTAPVGQYLSGVNSLGLHDLGGNVFEWCNDWGAGYTSSAQTDPAGPSSGTWRVCRGGSWATGESGGECARRDISEVPPASMGRGLGFRICRNQ